MPDPVDLASKASFPASDPPAYTPASALGPPAASVPVDAHDPGLHEEVHESPESDPATRSQTP